MNKWILILPGVLLLTGIKAQSDSLKKLRLSGIQLDISPNGYLPFHKQGQEDYRKFIENDPNVAADISSYKNQPAAFYRVFDGLISLKFFCRINDGKKLRKEIFFGLRYGQELNSTAYYSKTNYDTVTTFTDVNNNQKLLLLTDHESVYSYGMHSQKLIVPFGINFSTDPQKIFWITYGLEIAPAVNFDYTFRSEHYDSYRDLLLFYGDSVNSQYNYARDAFPKRQSSGKKTTRLPGLGYGISAALPFTAYFHPFRKWVFVRHFNFLVSVTPMYLYSHSRYAGSASFYNVMFATGIRYNL